MNTSTSPRPASMRRWLRATFGALPSVPRRGRRDKGFLALYAALTAVIACGALAAPVALDRSADAGLRSTVALGGPDANLRVDYVFPGNLAHPEAFPDRAVAAAAGGLPEALTDALGAPTASLRTRAVPTTGPDGGTPTSAGSADGADDADGMDGAGGAAGSGSESAADPLDIALAYVQGADLTWVAGAPPERAPKESGAEPEVVLAGIAATTAAATGLAVDDRVTLALDEPVQVRITGIFEPDRPDGGVWTELPGVMTSLPASEDSPASVTLLAGRDSLPVMLDGGAHVNRVTARFAVDPAQLGTDSIDRTRRAVAEAKTSQALMSTTGAPVPVLSTTLDDVLDAYAQRLDTARAQAATVLMGVAVSGALILVLAAGLLVQRRRDVLELERARGASVVSLLVQAAAEAIALTLVAGVAAVAGALAVAVALPGDLAGGFGDGVWWLPGAVVLGVAAAGPVVLTVREAIGAGSVARVAANRRDRARSARRGAAWRRWAEIGVVLLAAMGVAGAWSRGLVPGGDLLLSAAPALVAAACTVLVLRVVPLMARAAARAASRGTGLIGLVAASRAATGAGGRGRGRGVSPASVLAVTMTCALAVSCAAAAATVRAGQEHAGDVVVGADARIDRPSEELAAAALEPRHGVTTAAGTVFGSVVFGGDADTRATVLALDTAAFEHLDGLAAPADDGAVRAHVPPMLSDVADELSAEIYVQGTTLPIRITRTVDTRDEGPFVTPTGTNTLPVIVVDRSVLADALGEPVADLGVSTVWLFGPGAGDTAAELTRAATRFGETAAVLTRDDYERELRADDLTEGLLHLYSGGAGALLLLGALAIALTVQATTAGRARVLAVLRTIGVPARSAARLAVEELAPALGAAVIAGLGSGVVVAALLTSAQGLGLLAGGGEPTLLLAWWPFAAAIVAAAGVLVAAAWLEARSRRQIRIGEVLRTW